MPSKYKQLPPAEEVGDEVSYDLKAVRVYALSGWKFQLFLEAMKTPLFRPVKTIVFKNMGVGNVLLDLS